MAEGWELRPQNLVGIRRWKWKLPYVADCRELITYKMYVLLVSQLSHTASVLKSKLRFVTHHMPIQIF